MIRIMPGPYLTLFAIAGLLVLCAYFISAPSDQKAAAVMAVPYFFCYKLCLGSAPGPARGGARSRAPPIPGRDSEGVPGGAGAVT